MSRRCLLLVLLIGIVYGTLDSSQLTLSEEVEEAVLQHHHHHHRHPRHHPHKSFEPRFERLAVDAEKAKISSSQSQNDMLPFCQPAYNLGAAGAVCDVPGGTGENCGAVTARIATRIVGGGNQLWCVDTYACPVAGARKCRWQQDNTWAYNAATLCTCGADVNPMFAAAPPGAPPVFAVADIAADLTNYIANDAVNPVINNINTLTWVAGLVTAACGGAHLLASHQNILIQAGSQAAYRGRHEITVTGANTFTFFMPTPGNVDPGVSNNPTATLIALDQLDPVSGAGTTEWQTLTQQQVTAFSAAAVAAVSGVNAKTVVTITLANEHNLEDGDYVNIINFNVANYNGYFAVTVPDVKVLQYTVAGVPAAPARPYGQAVVLPSTWLREPLSDAFPDLKGVNNARGFIAKIPPIPPLVSTCYEQYVTNYLIRFAEPYAQAFWGQMFDFVNSFRRVDNDRYAFFKNLLANRADIFKGFFFNDIIPFAVLLHPGWNARPMTGGAWAVGATKDQQVCTLRTQGFIDYIQEVAHKAFTDRAQLSATFLTKTSGGVRNNRIYLNSITTTGSDPHGGRRVLILDLRGARTIVADYVFKVVYKPRDIRLDRAFVGTEATSVLNMFISTWLPAAIATVHPVALPLVLNTPTSLLTYDFIDDAQHNYGWVEFVEPQETVLTDAEAQAYYTRSGVLMAIIEAFGLTDVHGGNVIRVKDQMALIDLEVVQPGQSNAFELAMTTEIEIDLAYGWIMRSSASSNKVTVDTNPNLNTQDTFNLYRAQFSTGYSEAIQVLADQRVAVGNYLNNNVYNNAFAARVLPLSTGPQKERVARLLVDKAATTVPQLLQESVLASILDNIGNLPVQNAIQMSLLLKSTAQQIAAFDVPIYRAATNAATITGVQTTSAVQLSALQQAMATFYLTNPRQTNYFLDVDAGQFAGALNNNLPQTMQIGVGVQSIQQQALTTFNAMMAQHDSDGTGNNVFGGWLLRKIPEAVATGDPDWIFKNWAEIRDYAVAHGWV